MKDSYKSALGAVTAWPAVYIVVYFFFSFWVFFSTAGTAETPAHVATAQAVANVVSTMTVLLTFALLVVYLVLIAKNSRLDASMKMAWVIVVLMGSIAGMLVYWYLQIRSESQEELGLLGVGLRMAAERKAKAADEDAADDANPHDAAIPARRN